MTRVVSDFERLQFERLRDAAILSRDAATKAARCGLGWLAAIWRESARSEARSARAWWDLMHKEDLQA